MPAERHASLDRRCTLVAAGRREGPARLLNGDTIAARAARLKGFGADFATWLRSVGIRPAMAGDDAPARYARALQVSPRTPSVEGLVASYLLPDVGGGGGGYGLDCQLFEEMDVRSVEHRRILEDWLLDVWDEDWLLDVWDEEAPPNPASPPPSPPPAPPLFPGTGARGGTRGGGRGPDGGRGGRGGLAGGAGTGAAAAPGPPTTGLPAPRRPPSPDLAGSRWRWCHDGVTAVGTVELRVDGRVRVNSEGGARGHWSWDAAGVRILATFNGVDHALRLQPGGHHAVLEWPARDPPSVMTLITEEDGGSAEEDVGEQGGEQEPKDEEEEEEAAATQAAAQEFEVID